MLAMQLGKFSSQGWVHHHGLDLARHAGLPLLSLVISEPGGEARLSSLRQAHPLLLLEVQDAVLQPGPPRGEFLRGGQPVGAELFPICPLVDVVI